MPPSKGSAIVYGKITLSTEVESIDMLIQHLGDILSKYGYPDQEKEKDGLTKEDEERFNAMMKDNGAQDK